MRGGYAQLREQLRIAHGLGRKTQPRGTDDLHQFRQGYAKFLINNNIFAFRRVRDLAAGSQQAARDDLGRILAAGLQAAFQLVDGRRQDEYADGLGVALLDLPRALPVDFQQDVMAGAGGLVDAVARVP